MEAIASGPSTAFIDSTLLASFMDESLSTSHKSDVNVMFLRRSSKKLGRLTPTEVINGTSMKVSNVYTYDYVLVMLRLPDEGEPF